MIVQLPRSVRFPVTITAFLKRPNDEIPRLEAVLLYTYTTTVTEYPEFGEERQVEKKLSAQFHAPVEGRLHRWLVKVGTVIDGPGVNIMEIDEPCSHEVQFAGLCSMCGQDMTLQDHGHFSNKDRATIHMVHDSMGLTVSQDEATRLEKETKRRLLESKKLSLVVDLDQTIIHATVDPTVGDWKNDPFCINHESVKDVQAFKLDEDIIGGRGTWYYVKMRPGLKEFLEHISELYELHIYTMGTRAYAMSVKKIVDPDGRIFGERVLSRDESGSMTQKSLHRIFPVDTKMVVIIDDRGDVWKWSDNLVKVRPYDFFVGIGDINSSFLPKRQEFLPPAPAANAPVNPTVSPADMEAMPIDEKVEKGDDDDDDDDDVEGVLTTQSAIGASSSATQLAALDQLVTIGEGVSAENLLNAQSKELDKALSAQKTDRPLAKKQEEQDKKDEKAANECMNGENGIESTTPSEAGRAKHSVLHDQDVELIALERHLTEVHRSFYELYENNRSVISARVSELKDPKKQVRKRRLSDTNLRAVPDVKVIMPQMKMRALGDVVLVFSGIIPLGVDVQNSDIAHWCRSFGAIIADDVHSKVTHLVAARVFDPTRRSKVPRETNDYQSRTAKVRRAASKYPHIRIVTPQWLYDSISNWRKEPEDPYLLPIHPEDRHPRALNGVNDHLDGPMLSSEDDDSDDDEMQSVHTEEFSAADMPDMTDVGWMDVDEELKEWLGSDDDEDTEAEDNNASDDKDTDNIPKKASKRSRSSTPDEETGELSLEDSIPGSRLSKRQKMVRNRPGSGLRIVEGVAPSTSSYAPPSGTDTPDSSSGTLDGISEKGLEQEFDELEEAAGEEDEEDDFDGFAQEFDRELAEMEADENGDDEEDTVGDEGTIVAGAQNEHSQPESSHHLIDLGSPITDSFNSLSGAGGSLAEAGGGGGGSTNSTS